MNGQRLVDLDVDRRVVALRWCRAWLHVMVGMASSSPGLRDANVSGGNHKLVWFVPREALDATRDAVFAAGAGRIGDYKRCSWYTAGTGTFLGGEATEPKVGERGREERASELRSRRSCRPSAGRGRRALVAAHPYEEAAYDLYPLA